MIAKRLLFSALAAASLLACSPTQSKKPNYNHGFAPQNYPLKDSIEEKGFKLLFLSNDSTFSPVVKTAMIKTFFTVYPPLVERFNKESLRRVVFIIDKAYDGIAVAFNGWVVFNPKWFAGNPKDFDVVTHEVMHIVQNYGNNNVPGWVTEGIADLVRYRYGINNAEANWSVPDLQPDHHYTSSYSVTARFFAWLEERKDPLIIDKLNMAAHTGKYHDNIWVELTERTIDQLWEEYKSMPELVSQDKAK
jgi:hypothetical protein